MENLDKLSEIIKEKDISQISFLKNNLNDIFLNATKDIQPRDFRSLGYFLYSLIELDQNYRYTILKMLSKHLKVDFPNRTSEFIVWILMHVSKSEGVEELLDKILYSKNYQVKKYLFYHEVHTDIYYVQTEKFRQAIISYINSDYFKHDYPRMKAKSKYHYFPGQYFQSFDFTCHLSEFKEGISKSKQQKLVTEYRINSIRFINDNEIRSDVVRLYYHLYLPTLYKTRFVTLVKREFPDLKLEWYNK